MSHMTESDIQVIELQNEQQHFIIEPVKNQQVPGSQRTLNLKSEEVEIENQESVHNASKDADLKAGMASPLRVASCSSEWVRSRMRSMGLCCGCALVESRLSEPAPPQSAATFLSAAASAMAEEAEWWRGRR